MSTMIQIKKPSIEEINARIDTIIIGAMLILSDNQKSDPRTIYTDKSLLEFLHQPIMDLGSEKVDLFTIPIHFSNMGASGRCINLLEYGAKAYFWHGLHRLCC
ncbi:hypothetical protein RF11_04013 [Thelohanellus kitauei]|uniref:Uncharacterized protein n=1 Tax=Thelohanellus kitauei TaxID=669202 RepID=A0A0C2MYM5_THEKT|nr:hypothetical protein RF11_04013 [Thelohanellus kitauei]